MILQNICQIHMDDQILMFPPKIIFHFIICIQKQIRKESQIKEQSGNIFPYFVFITDLILWDLAINGC
jgi:hypothetical protein